MTSTFGNRLREARARAGLTQEEVGLTVGVSKSAVSSWENDRDAPSIPILAKIRDLLRVSLDDLICGDHERAQHAHVRTPTAREPLSRHGHKYPSADPRETVLLERFRVLPIKRKDALLELMRPEP